MNTVTPRTRTGESCGNQLLKVEDKMFGLSKIKFFALLAVVLIVAASASAFAAGITVPGPVAAGQGTMLVTGFDVGNSLHFDWDSGNPALLTKIEFTLTAPTDSPVATWADITVGEETLKSCTAGSPSGLAVPFTCTWGTPVITAAEVTGVVIAAGSAGTTK